MQQSWAVLRCLTAAQVVQREPAVEEDGGVPVGTFKVEHSGAAQLDRCGGHSSPVPPDPAREVAVVPVLRGTHRPLDHEVVRHADRPPARPCGRERAPVVVVVVMVMVVVVVMEVAVAVVCKDVNRAHYRIAVTSLR